MLLAPAPAQAQVAGRLTISASVPTTCQIGTNQSATGGATIDLGGQEGSGGAGLLTPIQVPIACNDSVTAPKVSVDLGSNSDGINRRMLGPAGRFIQYQLILEGNRVWDGSFLPLAFRPDGTAFFPIAGVRVEVPPGTPDGIYIDTLVITVSLES